MAQGVFGWVAIFIAFHVYRAFGGKIGFADATQTQPKVDSAAKWVFPILVDLTFVVAVVPLALYQDWGHRIPAWILAWSCWTGAAILLLRGSSGVLDTSLRGTGLVRNGLTGLTYKEELGVAHPSAYTQTVPPGQRWHRPRSDDSSEPDFRRPGVKNA